MERNDIIKALECCGRGTTEDCANCPRFDDDRTLSTEDCMERLMRDALSLIKELTEENERLENALIEQSAENVMLCGEVKHARVDTVRKMQTEIEARCIKGGIYPAFVKSTIDQIAKEMIGEKND